MSPNNDRRVTTGKSEIDLAHLEIDKAPRERNDRDSERKTARIDQEGRLGDKKGEEQGFVRVELL